MFCSSKKVITIRRILTTCHGIVWMKIVDVYLYFQHVMHVSYSNMNLSFYITEKCVVILIGSIFLSVKMNNLSSLDIYMKREKKVGEF